MSQLPKPSSRLPAPSTSKMRPPTVPGLGLTRTGKRPAVETAEAAENAAKRAKPATNLSNSANFSKSMMHLPTTSQGFGSKFAPIKNTTGRASTIVPGRLKTTTTVTGRTASASVRTGTVTKSATTVNRTAMADRTNEPGKSKRKPWDVKGRLEDMEELFKKTQERVGALENQNSALKSNVEEKETVVQKNTEALDHLNFQIESLKTEKEQVQKLLDEEKDKLRAKNRELDDMQYAKSSLERRITSLEGDLESKEAEVRGLKTTVADLTSASAGMEARLTATKSQLEEALEKVSKLEKLSAEQAESLEEYRMKERGYETERRKLHNTIQELKGNIRVFCRVRPLLGDEHEQGQLRHLQFAPGSKSIDMIRAADSPTGASTSVSGKAETFQFDFDHVFNTDANQEAVFEEVSQLIQSAIDGYNVCIFAYGQTGSGKTFTMEGGEQDGQEGIIPRTIRKIFEETSDLVTKGWQYKLEASFVEIYNEEIRDLLATEKGLKYEIKRSDKKSNEVFVTNLKAEEVTSGATINNLLKRATKNRAVAATQMNERSSRSHCVFILKITGSNSKTGETCIGCLNLVDLAGSERLKSSGSTGQRLEETKNINSSLSNLGKVILALANNKDGHIPYRDSKLTHLLMNSLGGNSKTLMFVNLSPKEESFGESLNSLRFAKRVNQCQIGTATKKV